MKTRFGLAAALLLACAACVQGKYGPIGDGSVCGEDGEDYASKEEAHAAGMRAINGGSCGECSNPHDIEIYNATRNTLTGSTKRCSFLYLFFGEWAARECMKSVDFTPGCNECWIENIKCDLNTKCLWICLRSTMNGDERNKPDGSLNDCLQCDEDVCGPDYVKCAGANRRRSGIVSDIDREGDIIWEGDDWP